MSIQFKYPTIDPDEELHKELSDNGKRVYDLMCAQPEACTPEYQANIKSEIFNLSKEDAIIMKKILLIQKDYYEKQHTSIN